MEKRLVLLATLVLLLVPVGGRADSMLDFSITSPASGSISYAGGANPLVGSGISVGTITGLPSGTSYPVIGGSLDFTTGGLTGNTSNSWTFSGGGSIAVTGCVDADLDGGTCDSSDISGTLLTGQFQSGNSVSVTDFGGNFKIAGASFLDSKNPQLLALFGISPAQFSGNFNISFSASGSSPNAFSSSQVLSGDVVNNVTPVPEPAALLLLGTGLLGLGIRVRAGLKK